MKLRWLSSAVLWIACSPDPGPEELADAGLPDASVDSWEVFLDELDGVVLSFWGMTTSDLFAVGGTLGNDGGQARVLHHDGDSWRPMEVDAPTLWWVHGFAHDDVWAVGEQGTIVHFDGDEWQTLAGGEDYTLWGIWGSQPEDIWAVGGSVTGSGPRALVLHYGGTEWVVSPTGLDLDVSFFKVWGTSADNLFVVGDGGTILRRESGAWTQMTSPTTDRLVTVWGRSETDVWAVGGLGNGTVLNFDGEIWTQVGPSQSSGLMGVWTTQGSEVVATGFRGSAFVGDETGWDAVDSSTGHCLHAVWGDGQGTVLAGGGALLAPEPPRLGVIVGTGPGISTELATE